MGSEKITQGLRALAAVSGDLGLVPGTRKVAHSRLSLWSQRPQYPPLSCTGAEHAQVLSMHRCADVHAHKTPMHTKSSLC